MGKRAKNKKAVKKVEAPTQAAEEKPIEKVEASNQTEEKTVEKLEAANQTEEMTDILALLECPVCLDDIQQSPIYVCENSRGHSVCSKCHKTLKNERKPCPTCRQPLADRRNLGLENLLEILLKKCRYEDCSFKASTGAAMEKHEEDWHRFIFCAFCDNMIEMKGFPAHLEKNHDRVLLTYDGLSKMTGFRIGNRKKSQIVLAEQDQDESPKFVLNRARLNEGAKVFWLAFLGPKEEAKTFMYSLQIKGRKDMKKYLLEGTRLCEPCDLTHQEMKREMSGIVVSKKLLEQAADENDSVHVDIIIEKV